MMKLFHFPANENTRFVYQENFEDFQKESEESMEAFKKNYEDDVKNLKEKTEKRRLKISSIQNQEKETEFNEDKSIKKIVEEDWGNKSENEQSTNNKEETADENEEQKKLDKERTKIVMNGILEEFKQSNRTPKDLRIALENARNLMSTDQDLSDEAKEHIFSKGFEEDVLNAVINEGLLDDLSMPQKEGSNEGIDIEDLNYSQLEINSGYDKNSIKDIITLDDYKLNNSVLGLKGMLKEYKRSSEMITEAKEKLKMVQQTTDMYTEMRIEEAEGSLKYAKENQIKAFENFRKAKESYENFREKVKKGTYSGKGSINNFYFDIKRVS